MNKNHVIQTIPVLFLLLFLPACAEDGPIQQQESASSNCQSNCNNGDNGQSGGSPNKSGTTQKSLSFTGTGGGIWSHEIEYHANDLTRVTIKSVSSSIHTSPGTKSATHVVSFNDIPEGECHTFYFANGTIISSGQGYEANIFYCRSGQTLDIQHGANIDRNGFNPPFQSHGTVLLN